MSNKNKHSLSPPRQAILFLRWYCRRDLVDEVEGDLYELFQRRVEEQGVWKAKLLYWLNVLMFLHPDYIRKRKESYTSNHPAMFKHYLNVIRRNFVKHPLHISLNTFCLAISITSTLFMLLYIHFELTYDRFHSQAEHIYRIETPTIETHDKVSEVQWTTTPANLITYLAQDFPEIEAAVRCFTFWQDEEVKLQYQDKIYIEEDIFAADAALLDIFSFDLISGDAREALHGPNKIILSETLTKRIFGNQDPIGKLLESKLLHNMPDTKENYTLMVTGVYRDLPKNTHLPASAVISSATDPYLDDYYFNHFNVFTYVLLPPQNNPISLASGLSQIYAQYLNANLEPVLVGAQHRLAPLTSIHLQESGGLTYVYIFGAVSLLLLGLAIISYVNLLTAQANHRILEVGIRKVMGSRSSQLIFQFMVESFFYAGISLIAGIILLILSIDFLNVQLGLQLNLEQLGNPSLLFGMMIIFAMLGGLGGSYPAFVLSSFQPLLAMKDRKIRGRPVQSILLTVQFSVVLFVLSCTMMIDNQLQFLRNKDLGFDKEQIVMLSLPDQDGVQRAEVFKEALLANTTVVSVGAADFVPGNGDMIRGPVSADSSPDQESQFVRRGFVDYDLFETLNVPLIAGRYFSPDYPGDLTHSVIINQAFAELFNLENPIGEKVRIGGSGNPNFLIIIGLVENFHQGSLHSPLEPQMFRLGTTDQLMVKVSKNPAVGLQQIKKTWTEVFPNLTFDFSFLDETLQNLYTTDQIRARVFVLLSFVTVIISFTGLYGLASFLAKQRVKEIGIRKVLGANLTSIVRLITKRFIMLVFIAALPAFLLSWLIINVWLESFPYRADFNLNMLGLILLFVLLMTFITTGWHALRAALANPVDSLHND